MSKAKVILAYTDELDCSCILKWLIEKNYDVIGYIVNIGQNENFDEIKARALKLGASSVIIDDLQEKFVVDYVWPAIQMGLIYESRYLLGTSLAKPCISEGLIKAAKAHEAEYVAHGATAKGNDQVRFELSCYSLWPEVKILAPQRDPDFLKRFKDRSDLMNFAKLNSIPLSNTYKVPWIMDANLMNISHESGILESPGNIPPPDLYLMTKSPMLAPEKPFRIDIQFKKGIPFSVNAVINGNIVILTKPTEMFGMLNKFGGEHGIGRSDIVENRFIGLKSRGVYENPAGYILHIAHLDLETFILDREVLRIKQFLQNKMSDYVYNGFWFSPEAEYVGQCLINSQTNVTGKVHLEIYKGSVQILGRTSEVSLYNEESVSMDKHEHFTPEDATGFINIQAIRLKEYYRVKKQLEN